MPSAVEAIWVEHRLATGRSGAGARRCVGTGLSSPGEVDGEAVTGALGVAVGLGWVAVFCGDEQAAAISAPINTTSRILQLAPAAQLPLDGRRDLVPRQVVKTVVVGAHAGRRMH